MVTGIDGAWGKINRMAALAGKFSSGTTASKSRSRAMPFLSSHPSGPERIATLKSLSRRLSK